MLTKNEIVLLIAIFLGTLFFAGTASAFFEDFESGNFETNNWTLSGSGSAWQIVAIDAYEGNYTSKVDPKGGESILETRVDTTVLTKINFSFYAQTIGLDIGEYVAADWHNGTHWINVLPETEDINSYTFYSYNLTNADKNPNFKIRFRCYASTPNERCYIDNVQVDGNKIAGIEMLWLDPDKEEINKKGNIITEPNEGEEKLTFIQNIFLKVFSIFLN